MVAGACSLVQCYFGVAAAAVGTIGEGIVEEDIAGEETVDGEIVDEEVGYEKTDFLDGSFSNQEIDVGLSIVPKVTKGYNST